MLSLINRNLNRIFDFFFPPVCFVCGRRERRYICSKCQKEIRERKIEDYENLLYLKKNHPEIRDILFLGDYKGNLRKNILSIKINKDRRKMKNAVFALCEAFNIKADHILTVPSFKERPYHTYNVVKYLSFICNINFAETALKKIIKTKKQKELKKNERSENLKGVFCKNMFGIFKKNSKIVIFDDIITTGNTVERILETLNTGEVYIISLAVAVKRTKG
jgi:predicted amidophosphoribosyltransferase